MKKINPIILTLIFVIAFSSTAMAKKIILQSNNDSVKLLNHLTEEGRIERSKDVPFEKADISDDIERALYLKYKFAQTVMQDFPTYEVKDVIKNPLLYKGLFE